MSHAVADSAPSSVSEATWLAAATSLQNGLERLLFLDAVSAVGFLMVQFVDDTFAVQSTAHGIVAVNRALTSFCHLWRHRFKLGVKGPSVLCVGCAPVEAAELGLIQEVHPKVVEKMLVLGVWLDRYLTLEAQVDQVCGRLLDGAAALVRKMNDLGFGIPFQVQQFTSRVQSSAFHGAEVLASYGRGWPQVVRRLNDVHYWIAKLVLGIPRSQSLGARVYVRAFSETRFLTRLGAELAKRVVLARMRLLLLPPGHPMESCCRRVAFYTGRNWLNDAEGVMAG